MSLFELDKCSECKLRFNNKIKVLYPIKSKGAIILGITGFSDITKSSEYKALSIMMDSCGMNIKDYLVIPALLCAGINRDTKDKNKYIDHCSGKIRDILKEYKIENVLLCGMMAIRSMIVSAGYVIKGKDQALDSFWRGFKIPDRDIGCWLHTVQDISWITYKKNGRYIREVEKDFFIDDLKAFKYSVDNNIPAPYDIFNTPNTSTSLAEMNMVSLLSEKEAIQWMRKILKDKPKLLVMDIEATGLKLFNSGHKIPYISFAISAWKAVAFRVDDARVLKMLKRVLESDIPKAAHNLKYEHSAFVNVHGISVNNWFWDSMLAAHIIDNRPGICGLKFLAYLYFGVAGYEKNSKKYWASMNNVDDGENAINMIHTANPHDMMLYNGLDSLFTFRLIEQQLDSMNYDEMRAYDLFHQGNLALIDMHLNGICYDITAAPKYMRKAERKVTRCIKDLDKLEIGRLMHLRYGDDTNYSSNEQLREVIYTDMGFAETKQTKSGKSATDTEVFEVWAQTHEFAKLILKMRQWDKIAGTFLKGFVRECGEDGKIHPNFNLHTTATFRSSSSSPNFQNVPIRKEEFSSVLRGAFKASPGARLIEVDYSGVEVTCAAWYHKDKEMIKYLVDPTTDMHRDMALQIFKINADQMDAKKVMRKATKNSFVFPQFYGDYYKNCAKNLNKWILSNHIMIADGTPIYDHLKTKGINNYNEFESHIQTIEDWFWNTKFKAYGKWKKKNYATYLKKHEFSSYLGFPYRGIMNDRAVNNYAIQGTGFHVLLWSIIQLNNWIKEKGLQKYIKLVGQVHDSIVSDVHEDYVKLYVRKSHSIMTKATRKHFDFIITPLDVEYDITPINGSWHEKKSFSKDEVMKGKHINRS